MRHILAFAAVGVLLCLTWSAHSATPQAQNTPAKKTTAKKTGTAAKKSTGTTAARKGGKKAPARATWRNRQMAPTADRYREIQQALASKGYLKQEEATGVWNQNSVEALKRFQSEQKIESTGKINSLSLIALGLGPKHETATAKPPATPQPPVPDPAANRDR
jgi:peptidoglycan hydrolase-like protein with peptidoglycan-binding domain